jgi:hypothetical protein
LAALLTLTAPDGQIVDINPSKIVSLREQQGNHHDDVHCIISTSDGKYIGVVETCQTVLKMFNDETDRRNY